MPPLLSLDDVSVRYGSLPAVRSVSFEVGEGEIVGVLGPNGAGKSSLLSAIMGVVPPSGGEITFQDASLAKLSPERIARLGVALVPENRRIFNGLTVLENLRLGGTAKGTSDRLTERLDYALTWFPDLRPRLQEGASALSGGQQQQLAIARALMGEPQLLMLDEPSLGLSPMMIKGVLKSLANLRKESGISVLLAEQNAARTVEISDRIILLSRGRIVRSELADEIQSAAGYEGDYLGVMGDSERSS